MRKVIEIDWYKKYAQSSEDFVLRMLFPYATGTYVEVGVNHPINDNHTYILYELGWRGLLIEPQSQSLRECLRWRPEDAREQCAASDVDGQQLPLYLPGQNSPAASLRQDWCGGNLPTTQVRTRRMESIMAEHVALRDDCDICSIDVEGWERQVLEGIGWNTFKPRCFCVEAVRWNPFSRMHFDWEFLLLAYGYRLICHNLQNRFYGLIENNEAMWEQVKRWNLGE